MTSDVVSPTTKSEKSVSATQQPSSSSRRTSKSNQSPRSSSFVSSVLHHSTSTENDNNNSYNKDSWKSSVSSRSSLSSLRNSLPENPHLYDFKEIFTATNKFTNKKHSSSSSSTAWRCVIRGDDVIVFQRKLRRIISENELRERLLVICRSHHSSLIKLKGASMSGSYIYLVYDYIKGLTLSECLTNPKNPSFTILSTWMSRIQVAADLTHGIDYIHNSTGLEKKFIHNHIKSTSIIITESDSLPGSFNVKICHFGTAELCGETDKLSETKFEGTRGYMSPEYQTTGVPSDKSDVYAFGVVILELLSGKEALKYERDSSGNYIRVSVIETVTEAVKGGYLRTWIDRRLKDSYPEEVVEKLVRLAVECLDEDPDKRPDMRWIAGRVSKMYLESVSWVEQMGKFPEDFTVSVGGR
ncbi:Protein kinase, catalytic domain-containing protein [Artemisia annua]|uniref:Protein kinase, catalytic domain-containing protein n=1 Tax=Artemisia annua TaxID=35608 RepID=A0A2U1LS68_ARTAN|nr:Protein kinase, catalytic domain-containing protein [Artemisia annua]